jgi:DinB superfamily
METLGPLAARLEAAVDAMLALRPEIESKAPWALAELYGTEAEASWGPPEVLAHVEEMLPFWLGEVERILDGPASEPVPFGRIADDPVRIGIIGRDRTVPVRELFARIGADGRRVAARMRALTTAESDRTGLHPRLGPMTVSALLERFVTSHLEEHVVQLRETLRARTA